MTHNPEDHPKTHDPLGRSFVEPMAGGPVPGKLNLTIGEPKPGGIIISFLRDDEQSELFLNEQRNGVGAL